MEHFFTYRHHLTLRLLELFPQILLIALCNSRAMGEADENSDIDLFIIAKKGNLWTVRFIATALTALFCVRRRNTHGLQKGTPEYIKRTKDRFCLSFFITEEAMNFESIRLQPNDLYLDKWIATLVPLVNKRGTFEKFMEANGSVIPESGNPNEVAGEISGIQENQLREESSYSGIERNVIPPGFRVASFPAPQGKDLPGMTGYSEGLIKKLWLPKTLKTYEKLGKPWGIVISDTMLKFHDQDVRKEQLLYDDF